MPDRSKKQTTSRFVEFNINLKVPRKQFPMVEEALTAVLDLAGLKLGSEAADKSKTASVAKRRGRTSTAKPVKTETGQQKQAKPAQGRRTAIDKKPPETAALIRTLRTEVGLSQKMLADKLGIRQNTISLLETGKQKPNLDMAVKLGQMLKTPFKNFMD